jgi:ribosome-associated translation inhibitor RaiA
MTRPRVYAPAQASLSAATGTAFTLGRDGVDDQQEATGMKDQEAVSTLTQTIEGPVARVDRLYAFDRLRDLCRTAPRPVRRARTRLATLADAGADRQAEADGTLLFDGGLIVSTAVTATTVHEAIDLLLARFRHRLERLGETRRDQPIGSFPANAA